MIDDERVITLLHDAVPGVPDVPGRIDAVRRRAARQRTQAWVQTIGSVAAVVLVVGLVAAVARPRGTAVRPVSDPLRTMADALVAQTSVRFEITSAPAGDVPSLGRMSPEQVRDALDSRLTGQFAKDGTGRVDGRIALLDLISLDDGATDLTEMHLIEAGDATYRTPFAGEDLPSGKRWIRGEGNDDDVDLDAARRTLLQAAAFTQNVHFVRDDTVRGTRVAVYQVTIPGRYVRGDDVVLELSLDRHGLPRRLSSTFDARSIFGALYGYDFEESSDTVPETVPPLPMRATIELWGYGDRVDVAAPPPDQVVDEDEVDRATPGMTDVCSRISGPDMPSAEPSPSAGWTEYPECVSFGDSATATLQPVRPSPAGTEQP